MCLPLQVCLKARHIRMSSSVVYFETGSLSLTVSVDPARRSQSSGFSCNLSVSPVLILPFPFTVGFFLAHRAFVLSFANCGVMTFNLISSSLSSAFPPLLAVISFVIFCYICSLLIQPLCFLKSQSQNALCLKS